MLRAERGRFHPAEVVHLIQACYSNYEKLHEDHSLKKSSALLAQMIPELAQ